MNLIKMTRREKYPFEKINLHLEGYSKIESRVVSSIRLTTVRERVTSFVKLSVNKSNKVRRGVKNKYTSRRQLTALMRLGCIFLIS